MSRRDTTSLLGAGSSVPRWLSGTLGVVAALVLVVAALVATDLVPAGTVVPGRLDDAAAAASTTTDGAPVEATAQRPSALPQQSTTTPTPTGAVPVAPRSGAAPQGAVVAGPQPIPASAVVVPTSVSVPALGVTAPITTVGRDEASGELVPPESLQTVGWYGSGPAPGDRGPAVVAGHVDSRQGPASFFALRDLRPGDTVGVTRSDGSTVTFRVTRVDQYDKGVFPSANVYGPTPGAELRLITCGGVFDPAVRSYRDNIVVYAVKA